MAQLKKLHMADGLEDLRKLTTIPDLRNTSMKMLLNAARKLLLTAEDYRLDGDQELAYITYMKYFNMLTSIRAKSDYNQHKQSVRQMLGDTDANRRIMDTLEQITASLSKRYNLLLSRSNGTPISPTLLLPMPPAEPVGETKSIAPAVAEYAQLGVISCETLFQRMQQKSVLVMDCRSSADYNHSHLTYYCAFNVPEELISPGMSAGKLQALLSSSAKASWASRSVKESVVLMDWNSKDAQTTSNITIVTLLDILKNWDPDVIYRSPIQILEGGYEYFIMMYPTHSTNPIVQAPQQNNNDIDTLDDIEYPSINDITMKEDILNGSENVPIHKQRPSINRASKPAALRAYDSNHQSNQKLPDNSINEIMRDQVALLQRAQQNDILLDNAAKKWKSIIELKRLHAEGAVLSGSEQEVLYNILQLESRAEDYKME